MPCAPALARRHQTAELLRMLAMMPEMSKYDLISYFGKIRRIFQSKKATTAFRGGRESIGSVCPAIGLA